MSFNCIGRATLFAEVGRDDIQSHTFIIQRSWSVLN
ncbi:predicted protein [Plenodomus lingam JN3]|uniref:Predicted protein n=1 Tax=Leptosphaeria maculans (strain JN3 / isolate v23.1.3 / race Av1-4-5-6-7-8) TaxID=985895 RepID=E5A2S0_LEPMJ|nr:predicted protein [Plenodomus lingam JN3]CBX97866.1 predicted protein [Plenodomus lingam JN3]